MACLVRAAEAALADAYQFSGGPLPGRGLVLGRGSASFRVVKLGGHRVRKARGDAADAHDAADVFLYVGGRGLGRCRTPGVRLPSVLPHAN